MVFALLVQREPIPGRAVNLVRVVRKDLTRALLAAVYARCACPDFTQQAAAIRSAQLVQPVQLPRRPVQQVAGHVQPENIQRMLV